MKLISCHDCGVVLDQEQIIPPKSSDPFDQMFYDDDYNIRISKAQWNGDRYVACAECPICKELIETDIKL